VEDLAQPGGNRPERWPLDSPRHLDSCEALRDDLPAKIDVGVFVEDDRDLREPETRDGPNLDEPW
jgi:hypothetical protein